MSTKSTLVSNKFKKFFLECAGELRINILRRMKKGGKEPPKTKLLQDWEGL